MSRKFNYPNKKANWKGKRSKIKRNKFHAKKVHLDGCVFDSKTEARYYQYLKLQGIKHFSVHESFEIIPSINVPIDDGKAHKQRKRRYTPDFVIYDDDGNITKVVDVKGQKVSDAASLRMAAFTYHWKLPIYIARYDYKHHTFKEYVKR